MSESVVLGGTLGTYAVLGRLGAGGMGEVLLALDTRLDRRVAIKVLPRDAAADPERLRRFERKARALAALNLPDIVTSYSVEQAADLHFYTMELVEGRTLAALIPPAGMPVDWLLALAIPLTAALEAAHGRGITHRDLKPGNFMVTAEGNVKVLDFGLAKLGVGAVLEGSVGRSGERARITAQLVDVTSGFHHWSERFDRTLADVFAIQDEISLAIVGKLRVHLRNEDKRRLTHRATESRAAHDAYLKGRFFFYRRQAGDLERAIEQYRLAVATDPMFAPPLLALAQASSALAVWGLLTGGRVDEAIATLRRALEMSPELAPAHLWLGVCQAHQGDHNAAIASYRRSLQGGLVAVAMAFSVASLVRAGRVDEARAERDRLEALAGEHYVPAIFRAWAAFALGDEEGAAAHVERAAADGEPCVVLTSAVAPAGLKELTESAIARHRRSATSGRSA